MDDYLALEDQLVERIRQSLPELKAVLTATDLASIQDDRKNELSAHVVYLGDDIPEGPDSQGSTGKIQLVTQNWLIVLVVKFAGAATGKGNRKVAGPLISKLLVSLQGWQPVGSFKSFRRANAPRVIYNNGFGYYPFAFKTTFFVGSKT